MHLRHFFQLIVTDYIESKKRLVAAGVPEEQVVVIGNLMVDAVAVHCDRSSIAQSAGLDLSSPVVGLLPGSRPGWLDLTLHLFLAAADLVAAGSGEIQFILPLAPTITWEDVAATTKRLGVSLVVGRTAIIPPIADGVT